MKEDLLEIEADIDIRSGEEVHIGLTSSGEGEIVIGYDSENQWIFIDRSKSGVTDFHSSFACKHGARIVALNGKIKLHIWLDRNSVEVYADHGLVALTDQIFPDAPIENVEVSTKSGQVVLDSIQIHTLKSITIPGNTAELTVGRDDA